MSTFPQLSNINIGACFSVLRHIYATNITNSLLSDKFQLTLLRSQQNAKFITGDQPVIDTHAAFLEQGDMPNDTEFFYPISPTVAILITSDTKKISAEPNILSDEEVGQYNSAIFNCSYAQIYASSENELDCFVEQSKVLSKRESI